MAHIKEKYSGDCLVVSRDGISIPIDQIIFVESNLHIVIYHVVDHSKNETEYTERCRLKDVEDRLKDYPFCRIHQSYLVNMNFIKRIKRYCVILLNGRQINVSKKRYNHAKEKIIQYKEIV